jgi:glycyl-tRNA synthetase (class II)
MACWSDESQSVPCGPPRRPLQAARVHFPQSSEIYGGLNGFWDYGPLGCALKRNIREAWWTAVVQRATTWSVSTPPSSCTPRAWEASGHVGGFADPMVDCRACRKRFRADQLCEEQGQETCSPGPMAGDTSCRPACAAPPAGRPI